MVHKALNCWVDINLKKVQKGQDYPLAKNAVRSGYWKGAPLHELSMEEKAFACYFGALGGNIVKILEWLDLESSTPKKNLLMTFAVIGYAVAHGGSLKLPPLDKRVIEMVHAFLHKNKIRKVDEFVEKVVEAKRAREATDEEQKSSKRARA